MDDLIRRAVAAPDDDLFYVVAIGAITNDVAAALLLEPDLVRKIVVVWLGGNTHHQPSTMEFNLMQDPDAARSFSTAGSSRFLAGRGFAPSDHAASWMKPSKAGTR